MADIIDSLIALQAETHRSPSRSNTRGIAEELRAKHAEGESMKRILICLHLIYSVDPAVWRKPPNPLTKFVAQRLAVQP